MPWGLARPEGVAGRGAVGAAAAGVAGLGTWLIPGLAEQAPLALFFLAVLVASAAPPAASPASCSRPW